MRIRFDQLSMHILEAEKLANRAPEQTAFFEISCLNRKIAWDGLIGWRSFNELST